MHEIWLQKYIKEHYLQIGFNRIHGPYSSGSDFKGFYDQNTVKIEAEWDYTDYIRHKHGVGFADVLVVATLEPVPERLAGKLPSIIKNLDRKLVIAWAQPRFLRKNTEDYYAYHWRRLSKSLLELYACYQQKNHRPLDFLGADLANARNKEHTPEGFKFGAGGKSEGFSGSTEDKAAWDYWLLVAHDTAAHFHLKPALLRPTWIDRTALYLCSTGRMTEGETKRYEEVGLFLDGYL